MIQVKYIVYYTDNLVMPKVDIWTTTGELVHPKYMEEHQISRQQVSSLGYIDLFPHKAPHLEHHQNTDNLDPTNLADNVLKEQLEKRDQALVQRHLYRSGLLQDNQVVMESYRGYLQTQALKRQEKWRKLKCRLTRFFQYN